MSATRSYTATPILPLGTVIPPWGKVAAVANLGGERYYFFLNGSTTSMLPAFMFDAPPATNCLGAPHK